METDVGTLMCQTFNAVVLSDIQFYTCCFGRHLSSPVVELSDIHRDSDSLSDICYSSFVDMSDIR